ncbi:MAG: polysaccharide biosynthesis C-terminal domain-containing protein [Anaerolineaceae bacterium]|nr:polysaccharide biosynthesis C-terminal domain-containing protein [Anaerolineaceae bacterium]
MRNTLSYKDIISNLMTFANNYNLVGLGLRGASIFGKFILVTYLATVFSLADLGIYGLFITSVVLVTYLLGLEFHTYTTREILAVKPEARPNIVLNQIVMHVGAYLLVLPFVLLIFWGGFLPWSTALLFYVVVIFVHIGQEIYRILIILSRPTAAYLVSFLLHGSWTFVVILVAWLWPAWQNLNVIFSLWAGSAFLGVIVGAILLTQMGLLHFQKKNVDFTWIWQGIQVGYKFFIGIIAYRIIDLSDRYFVQFFHGDTEVGIYTLFGSIANIAQEFVFAGFVSIIFPKIVSSLERGDLVTYRTQLQRLKQSVFRGSMIIGLVLTVGIYLLIFLLQREELLAALPAYFLLLGSAIVLNLSMIPHYQLYAHGQDRRIMWAVIWGLGLNLILNTILIPSFSIIGAALATILSFSVVGVLKWWFARQIVGGSNQ